ncbi:MAG: hypothetical protein WCK35_23040 [Chloroflexota bacterium]
MNNQLNQFSMRLDQLLGLHPGSANTADTSLTENSALQVASALKELDFESELAPSAELRSRWINQTRPITPNITPRRIFASRMAWFAALLLALALLAAFRQPVLAAVSRLLGYVYIQEAGFLPSDSTRILEQPVRQEHSGQYLTVTRALSTPSETVIWLEFSDPARAVDGAALTNETGLRLDVSHWQFSPNTPASHGVVMYFPAMPADVGLTTLSLREGWQLPLTWIPASKSHLPDVRAVPYPAQAQPTAQSPSSTQAPAAATLCQQHHDVKLCVLAATTTVDNTSILIDVQTLTANLKAGGWVGQVWQTDGQSINLKDSQGNEVPLTQEQGSTLLFPPIPSDQRVTLTIPAALTSLELSGQSIRVDLGANPQPDTVIPLDITIPVMATAVHFSQATFVGDGINSLRLILDADPVQPLDGITPVSIEIGKPDRVDDLYGGGMLAGSKDIFVELIRPGGKITGVITIPLETAIVAVQGPFEFTINLTGAASPTLVPVSADPGAFFPAPTATPVPLDAYHYSGIALEAGDLVYTVLDGENTSVFLYNPDNQQSKLIATIPGAVAQIYIHPDRQGLDYLSGTHEFRDGFSYIDHVSLYTILFADVAPHLLFSFEANPATLVGTTVNGIWSPDGRYAIFRYQHSIPGDDNLKFLWLDMTCKLEVEPSGKLCTPHDIPVKPDLALGEASFSPEGKRILFSGSDSSVNGAPALFILNFNPSGKNDTITNIPLNHSDLKLGENLGSNWTPDGSIFTQCSDGMSKTLFCSIDPNTGNVLTSAIYTEHLLNYQLTSSGKQVLSVVINHNAPGKGTLEIHLFDRKGAAGPKLAEGREFSNVSMSSSERYLAYVQEDANQLNLIDLESGVTTIVQQSNEPWAISWVGWVR